MPDSDLKMSCGSLEIAVRPGEGGRLAHVRSGGTDLILPPGQVRGFYGDTFWPSPQARFDWPPPPVLDAEPYTVLDHSPQCIALRSAPDHAFGLQVEKRFELSEEGLSFEFRLKNIWDQAQQVAPWQVTRAAREGLLVWAKGERFTDADRVQKEREDPGCWFLHEASPRVFEAYRETGSYGYIPVPAVDRVCKFFTDARGWLAHIHRGYLLLRVFPDLENAQVAPRQGEIELYFNPERDYIEIENQGAFLTLEAGEHLTYPTKWWFGKIDPALPIDRLTPELIEAIEALRARAH